MELKLSQTRHLPLSSRPFIVAISIHQHFPVLAERWTCQIQELSAKGRRQFKKILVHVVKEGENLSAISKIYGVPIDEIVAANRDIVDVDFIHQGKHLNVPSSSGECMKMSLTKKIRLPLDGAYLSRMRQHLDFYNRHLNHKLCCFSSAVLTNHLPHAKITSCVLVLFPLLAFCIRCIIDAFHNRVAGDKKLEDENKSNVPSYQSKSRWRSALSDLIDPDAPPDIDSRPDFDFSEDEEHFQSENISQAYTELENDYQKFLSECGLSKWGYWRGGSPE